MSLLALLVMAVAALMILAFVALVLLWAFTEELPQVADHVPWYERLEPGGWAVRLEGVGRRPMRTFRLLNELLGGDVAAAKALTDHPPALVVEGVSEANAHALVEALAETGATASALPPHER